MATFCLAGFLQPRFGQTVQLGVLLGGAVLTGIPHGAFDPLVARPVLSPFLNWRWTLVFLAPYVGLAGLVWLGWVLVPAATLAAFLAVSVFHFGLGDTQDVAGPPGAGRLSVSRALAVVTLGALPLLPAIALHPADVAPILGSLAGVPSTTMLHAIHFSVWLMVPWSGAFLFVVLTGFHEPAIVAERLATACCFVILPPLLAFALYFTLGHAVRHMLVLAAWHSPHDPKAASVWLARSAIPASLLCIAAVYVTIRVNDFPASELLVPGFRLIAALTLPHIVVTTWMLRDRTGFIR
jgi:Brp/Blh family beta-carotene 15,15'-monooxygenase